MRPVPQGLPVIHPPPETAQDRPARPQVNHPTLLLYHARLDRLETAVGIAIAVAVVVVIALVAWSLRKGQGIAQREMERMRDAYPEAFVAFGRTVNHLDYETAGRIDYAKIVMHFHDYLVKQGIHTPGRPLT